jgi:uncharacterized protein YjiK
MTTHSFTSLRPFALSFVVLVLVLSTTARIHGASVALTAHFTKVAESGDYLQDDSDGGAGSGITYWPGRDSYLVLDNNLLRIIETNRAGNLRRIITLSGFGDPEEIHWIAGNTFFITQEKNTSSIDEIVVLTVNPNDTTWSISGAQVDRRLQFTLGQTVNNKGIEGCALVGNLFYFTTEDPITAGNPSVTTWTVWTTANEGSGTINVDDPMTSAVRNTAFSILGLNTSGRALDISGMATDGTYLWLLSDEGPTGSTQGRVIKMTTAGVELVDYTMPAFNSDSWTQPEGIELFADSDGLTKILLTGEVDGGAGVDFMTLRSQPSEVSIVANDALAGEPEGATTYPGQFTVTRSQNNHLVPLTINFSTASSTASSGSDYTSIGTSVQIPAGALSQVINVTPLNDTAYEKDETVVAALSTAPQYTVSGVNHTATVNIQSVFELAGATYAYAVNDNGEAVTDAGRHNADGSLAQTYSFAVYGINNAGNVVGNGYARIGGTTHNLGLLDGYTTAGIAINSRNSIVGYAANSYSCYWTYSGGVLSGPYSLADGMYADIDDWYAGGYDVMVGGSPGYAYQPYCSWPDTLIEAISSGQFPQGINKSGTVVGWEIDPVTLRDIGVMWHPCYQTYTILDYLPDGASEEASIYPRKINASDLIVGEILDGAYRACLRGYYSGGQWHYLDSVIGDSSWTFATGYDISDAGHIVGSGVHSGQGRCFLIRR